MIKLTQIVHKPQVDETDDFLSPLDRRAIGIQAPVNEWDPIATEAAQVARYMELMGRITTLTEAERQEFHDLMELVAVDKEEEGSLAFTFTGDFSTEIIGATTEETIQKGLAYPDELPAVWQFGDPKIT
jgi:hypothetical protein